MTDRIDAIVISHSEWSLTGQKALAESNGLQVTADEPSQFTNRGRRWVFDDVTVSDYTQSASHMAPAPAPAADSSGEPMVTVGFLLRGEITCVSAERTMLLKEGSAAWMTDGSLIEARASASFRAVTVSVSTSRLTGSGMSIGSPFGIFSNGLSLQRPALAFVLALATPPIDGEQSPAESSPSAIAAVLTQLTAGMFLEQRRHGMQAFDLSANLWQRAQAIIEKEYADPLLDPTSLAHKLHISVRHLQRSFAATDSTPSEAIRRRRLQAALAVLSPKPDVPYAISEVARQVGFGSTKELRNAMKAEKGLTPRQLRG